MITSDLSTFSFHGLQVSTESPIRATIPKFNQVLIVTILPWFVMVSINDSLCQSNRKRQKRSLCCHVYTSSIGILTYFPFPILNLWDWLGSTNPWLICIAKEPLPFRWRRFALRLDPTTTGILIPHEVQIHSRLPFYPQRTPTYHILHSK